MSLFDPVPIWQPKHPHRTHIAQFYQSVAELPHEKLADVRAVNFTDDPRKAYRALHRWSVEYPSDFYVALARYCAIVPCAHGIHTTHDDVVVGNDGDLLSWRYYPRVKLNYTRELLNRGQDNALAMMAYDENGRTASLTFEQLRHDVAVFAHTLRKLGIKPKDRVAGFVGNIPQAVIAYLGCAAIGAIWTSCAPELGVASVKARLGQVLPKVLISQNHYQYKGKNIDITERVKTVVESIESIEAVIFTRDSLPASMPSHLTIRTFAECLEGEPLSTFEDFDFDHPLTILYTSGTTGAPKCLVHGAGATLLNLCKEHILHCDVSLNDRVFYYTTTSWMMWNWLVGALGAGACIVLYDGHPTFRDEHALWSLANDAGVTLFGSSAAFIDLCRKAQVRLINHPTITLDTLKTITSTGSPLLADNFRYVYEHIHPNVHLASIAGGTDILGCFLMGCPALPLRCGELQVATLGSDVVVIDSDSDSGSGSGSGVSTPPQVLTNQKGQLAVRRAFINMPVCFWQDQQQRLYEKAYFHDDKGRSDRSMWRHGDYAAMSDDGGFVIYGRSDATLNPGGVRIGTAEIYTVVQSFLEIKEAAVVGYSVDDSHEVIVLLVVLSAKDQQSTLMQSPQKPRSVPEHMSKTNIATKLYEEIRQRIKQECSPRHIPAVIVVVPDLPKTYSGKISELAIRYTLEGRQVVQAQNLQNPESLGYIKDIASPFLSL